MYVPHTVDSDLTEMMSSVFRNHRERTTPEAGIARWDVGLWSQLTALGLDRLTGREDHGGSGAGWFEAAELIRAAVSNGVQIPLSEHDLLHEFTTPALAWRSEFGSVHYWDDTVTHAALDAGRDLWHRITV